MKKPYLFILLFFGFLNLQSQFDKYPKATNNENWKYFFVDSLGKPINAELYDGATPFMKGLATVTRLIKEEQQQALINAKGQVLVPFNTHYIANQGNGLAVVSSVSNTTVYNSTGKALCQCQGCEVVFYEDLKRFALKPVTMMEEGNFKNPLESVKLYDYKGLEIFNLKAQNIERITNQSSDYYKQKTDTLPYFKITVPRNESQAVVDIVTLDGKLVMDSVFYNHFIFTDGLLSITRSEKAAVMNTRMQQVIAFDKGYKELYPMMRYPVKNIFLARLNGRYGLIDINNKTVLPFQYQYPIEYSMVDSTFSTYTMSNRNQDSVWVFNTNGDTLQVPGKRPVDLRSKETNVVFVNDLSRKTGFMERKTRRVIIPAIYDALIATGSDSLLFFKGDTAGYINQLGKRFMTFPVPCRAAGLFKNNRAICLTSLPNGKVPLKPGPYNADVLQNKFVWVNARGKIIGNAAFDGFGTFNNGKALVSDEGRSYAVDTNLKRVKWMDKYDYYSYFHKGYAIIGESGNLFGIIDSTNKIVVPLSYNGFALKYGFQGDQANSNEQFGILMYDNTGNKINSNGAFLIPDIQNGVIMATKGETEVEINLTTNKAPVIRSQTAEDTLSQLYYYSGDDIIDYKEMSREHIPLDGREVIMIPFRQDSLFGFVSKRTGEWLIKPQYTQVLAVYREGAIVSMEDGYGFVDTLGKMRFGYFQNLFKQGNLYHGMYTAIDTTLPEQYSRYTHHEYYNTLGKRLFVEKSHSGQYFENGDTVASFRYGRLFTIRGKSGKMYKQIPLSTTKVFAGIHNNLLVYRSVQDGCFVYSAYDVYDKLIFSLPVNYSNVFGPYKISADLFGLYSSGSTVFINSKGISKAFGLEEMPYAIDNSDYFKSSRFVVSHLKSKRYGVVDRSGKTVVPFRYLYIGSFNKGYAIFKDTLEKYGLMDSTGKTAIYPIYSKIFEEQILTRKALTFYDGLCLLSSYCLVKKQDNNGNWNDYPEIDSTCYYYVDKTNKAVISLKSNIRIAGNFSEGLAPVLDQNNMFGFMDKNGKTVIAHEYEAMMAGAYPMPYLVIPEFINGFAYIKSYKGYIDRNGKKYFAGKRFQDHYDFSH